MRIAYETWKPKGEAVDTVRKAIAVCTEYQQRGYDLTLRQLYYQFVARGWLGNTQANYKRLGDVVNKARMAGLLDWSFIEDRTRNLEKRPHWADPAGVIDSAASSFGMDLWTDQPTRVEVWVEKEALAGVIERAADRYDCAWFACRGYVSQSEMHAAGQRLGRYIEGGQNVVIVHLGDHDPSGIDMTRDIAERISTFIEQDFLNAHVDEFDGDRVRVSTLRAAMAERCDGRVPFEVRRIALNEDQIEQYDPPPNPAKLTDSRAASYVSRFGDQSWELDALDPQVLDDLITEAIEDVIDLDAYEAAHAAQEDHRTLLNTTSARWSDVVEFLTREEAS
jgi:hypothetical protein